MLNDTTAAQPTQRVLAGQFLKAFFPEADEPVNLRAFYAKGDPRAATHENGKKDGGRKFSTTRRGLAQKDGDARRELRTLNRERGVYFVVNSGGDKDADINRHNAVFVEADDKTIEEQHSALDACPLPPSIRVETKKSVHAYWLLDGDCTKEQWREVQRRLIHHFDGDKTIKNPARVMRLPGYNHLTYTGVDDAGEHAFERKRVEVVEFNPDRRYTIDELLEAFPLAPKEEKRQKKEAKMDADTRAAGASSKGLPLTLDDITYDKSNPFESWKAALGVKISADSTASVNGAGNIDCRAHCHSGQGVTGLFFDPRSNGVTCNAGCELEQIGQAFGIPPMQRGAPSVTIGEGKIRIEAKAAERGKTSLTVRDKDGAIIYRDTINLDSAKDRDAFIKALNLDSADEAEAVRRELLNLPERLKDFESQGGGAATRDVERVISKTLSDGRLIEQINGRRFAVYDPQSGTVTYAERVEAGGAAYLPLNDDFVVKNGLHLPDGLTEYGDEKALLAEVEATLKRYCDAPERELKLAAMYVLLSYVADKLNEIPYLRASGEAGSGKSRFVGAVGLMCLRPILTIDPSAASLFRMMDAFKPTLIIDEFNGAADSEDAFALMQILNAGNQRLTSVTRVGNGPGGEKTLEMFSAFGPKLIAGLKMTDSQAFESRCISLKLEKTSRKDIPFRLTDRMLQDFRSIREKLYLWRLRNLSRDWETRLNEAESELKTFDIAPRFVQIAIPLHALIEDIELKRQFAEMLEARTDDAANLKTQTLEAVIVGTIYGLLFDEDKDGTPKLKPQNALTDSGALYEIEDGVILDKITVNLITDSINQDRAAQKLKMYEPKEIGKILNNDIGLKTRKIKTRQSKNRDKAGLVFDRESLAKVFAKYGYPHFREFSWPQRPQSDNSNGANTLEWGQEDSKDAHFPFDGPTPKATADNNLQEMGPLGPSNLPEAGGTLSNEPFEAADEAYNEMAKSRDGGAVDTQKSVSFLITRDQRQQLYDMGYSRADVDAMTPEGAHAILRAEGHCPPDDSPTAQTFDEESSEYDLPPMQDEIALEKAIAATRRWAAANEVEMESHRL